MNTLKIFLDISLLKAKPQDVPFSYQLLALTAVTSIVAYILALEPATPELARILGCQVTLLRVDQGEDLGPVEQGLLQMAGAGACQELVEQAEDRLGYYLECLARQHRSADLAIDTMVVQARPAEAILIYAESEGTDLIIMASHGRTGVRRWVFGSVTEKILRQAGRAMLIVRPPISQDQESDD